MALERLPNESPHLQSPNSSSRAIQSIVQVTDSVESTKRRHSTLGQSSTSTSKNAFEDKMPLLNQRRHTIGEVPTHSLSTRKANLDNLKSFKVRSFPSNKISFLTNIFLKIILICSYTFIHSTPTQYPHYDFENFLSVLKVDLFAHFENIGLS